MPETTGETENGRSISVVRNALPLNSYFATAPRGGNAEHQVERHGDGRHQQRQLDRRDGVAVGERLEVGLGAFAEGLDEDQHQRQHQHQRHEANAQCRSASI